MYDLKSMDLQLKIDLLLKAFFNLEKHVLNIYLSVELVNTKIRLWLLRWEELNLGVPINVICPVSTPPIWFIIACKDIFSVCHKFVSFTYLVLYVYIADKLSKYTLIYKINLNLNV